MDENNTPAMTSQRPYLIRALWEWINDNGLTPHLLVDANYGGVRVPPHTINDGRVVLNIADRAVAHLQMGNDDIAFSARFAGVTHAVIVPVGAVLAVYARENGQGMALPPDADDDGLADGATVHSVDDAAVEESASTGKSSVVRIVEQAETEGDGDDGDNPTPPTPSTGGRAHLRVIK